ncbi:27 kDa hemolymph protein-like [Thrips palmi]|uniref:27 kDa hemolymph protein-like n=1 Tax=Thrips palmi TaxID=161013 RepID=A0A6P8ZN80_THRPL|nr:27 kDa hemolymph protein-like [Thrips palmi]
MFTRDVTIKWAFLLALVYGATLVLSDDDLDLDLPDVEGPKLSDIPGFENLPINKSALPDPAEIERVLREKCVRIGGEEAFNAAKNAKSEAEQCLRGLIDFKQLTEEMEKAKPTGDLDEVFRKYCKKSPILEGCIMDFVNASNQCLTEAERGSKQLIHNVTKQLLGFVCYKEGDRIALFIAESGPECLSDKKEAVMHCVNTTFGKHLPSGTPNVFDLPQLIMGTEECKDVCSVRRCVVKELEQCKEPTPANIVQAMFDYVLKVTPCDCKAAPLRANLSSSSNVFRSDFISLALSSLILFLTLH